MDFWQTNVLRSLPVELSGQQVLHSMGCRPGSASFHMAQTRFPGLLSRLQQHIHPFAAFRAVNRSDGQAGQLVCLLSLLPDLEPLQTEQPLLNGLLLDAMASEYLFALDRSFLRWLHEQDRPFGISRRRELMRGFSLETGRKLLGYLEESQPLGVRFSPAGVLKPEKSSLYVLDLSDDTSQFHGGHSCSGCPAFATCSYRSG